MNWLLEREIERFFHEDRVLVFRQEPRGPASHLSGVLVIPARGEQVPPVGVPVRVRHLRVVERPGRRPFIVAHGIEPARIERVRVRVHDGVARGTVSAGQMQLPFEFRLPTTLPDGEYVGSVEVVGGQSVFHPTACVRCGAVATTTVGSRPVCRECDIVLTQELFASVEPAPDGPDASGPIWFHAFEGEED